MLLLRRYAPALAALVLFHLMAPLGHTQEADPFQSGVRPTEPLSPAEEQATFQVPPGFVVELVAAEPQILKPMNLAFDAAGRLWVTSSQEYPYAAKEGEGRDVLQVLSDTDGDGTYDKVTTFADNLNIPIGVYPYRNGAIVYSIPYIWNMQDTDGDGVADQRTRLLGPMGFERDTHGMNNAFRRGYDGWVYACHGFNNDTHVAGADGHEIHMNSGNTYRFRVDGSRVEHFTWGQVNPFGMAIDPWFNMFTADCHTKPIYQLLRGGYYPSFGKPHDGLGFVPPMMDHLHGSTAIAGVIFYDAPQFPEPYRHNMYSGNVMTSRVNRNSLVYHGSTIKCQEEEDFVKTTDPWFRPVDLQVGPDGAMYIADFYNRIIGHYEVPLEHPGRDRTSGRIWRVRYVGEGDKASAGATSRPRNLATASVDELITALDDSNLTYRMLALDQLVDRIGLPAAEALDNAARHGQTPQVQALALWALHRLGKADESLLLEATVHSEPLVRVHAIKVLSEQATLAPALAERLLESLDDQHPFVRRAAADAVAQHSEIDAMEQLLQALRTTKSHTPEDVLLLQGLKIALRNQLRLPQRYELAGQYVKEPLAVYVAEASLSVQSAQAAAFLLEYVRAHEVPAEQARNMIEHAARYAAGEQAAVIVAFAREHFGGQLEQQLGLLQSLHAAAVERRMQPAAELRAWARQLADELLMSVSGGSQWSFRPLDGAAVGTDPWVVQQRPSADGVTDYFVSSLPKGEQLTGVLRSPTFELPEVLSFYVAGHSGFPNKPLTDDNYVQLCDAASGAVLMRCAAPRNDTAHQVRWELAQFAGREAYLEIVDGDEANAYAWIAFGRIEPSTISIPQLPPAARTERQRAVAQIAARFQLQELTDALSGMLQQMAVGQGIEPTAAAAAARALLDLQPAPRLEVLATVLDDAALGDAIHRAAAQALLDRNGDRLSELLVTVMKSAPARSQSAIAAVMASSPDGAELLLELIEKGSASPRLLLEQEVSRRIAALNKKQLAERVATITSRLPSPKEELLRLIVERRRSFDASRASLENGMQVYTKTCATCHQLDGKGPLIGPQLDGIGNRGLDRLLEDVLDPNRNVDVAFRTTTLVLTSGKIVSGLLRDDAGETLLMVDEKGQEFRVPKDDIEEQVQSNLSLMPENIATTLTEKELQDLLALLLTKRGEAGGD